MPDALPNPPPRPWDRQPGESSCDYLDFQAWLQCPQRRPLREAALKLAIPLGRLRSLSSRHRWRWRAERYDDQRAADAQTALHRALEREARSMEERAQQFRQQEWALHELMIQNALQVMAAYKLSRRRLPSLADVCRISDLASILGRRACGMPETGGPRPDQVLDDLNYRAEVEAAIKKVYGNDTDINTRSPQPDMDREPGTTRSQPAGS
jgi:hypothetical protein